MAGVLGFGRGLYFREILSGLGTSYRSFYRLHTGDLVLSRVKAWEGALGLVPEDLDGHFVSKEFPSFHPCDDRLYLPFLDLFFRSKTGLALLQGCTRGIGARRERVKEDQFLDLEVPLPPRSEQRLLTARLLTILGSASGATALAETIQAELNALSVAFSHRADLPAEKKASLGWRLTSLSSLLQMEREPEKVVPSQSYRNLGIYSFGRGLFHKPDIDGQKTSARTLYRVRSGQFIYSRLFAFEGAFALVTESFDGCFVSNEFPTFAINSDLVSPMFLQAYFRSPWVWRQLSAASTGLGNRRQRVKPEALLDRRILLPPMDYQQRLAKLAQRLTSAKRLAAPTEERLAALCAAVLDRAFSTSSLRGAAPTDTHSSTQ